MNSQRSAPRSIADTWACLWPALDLRLVHPWSALGLRLAGARAAAPAPSRCVSDVMEIVAGTGAGTHAGCPMGTKHRR
jgi:hypothetical protein